MHAGVKYTERIILSQQLLFPRVQAFLIFFFLQRMSIFVSGQYGGWRENYLIPCIYKTPEDFNAGASSLVGKTMTIMMPIMIENVQNDYTFTFNIDKLLNAASK